MADGCPVMMWVTGTSGETQFINRAYREFCGVTFDEVRGDGWRTVVHPDDAAEYAAAFDEAVQKQIPFNREVRVRSCDGGWRWVATYASPRFSPQGEFQGHVGLCPDITERKQAEQALFSSEEKFRQLAENIQEVFWMMSPSASEILYVSPAYEQVWGSSCQTLYQNPMAWLGAIHPDDREQAHLTFERQLQGDPVGSEYRIRTPEGREKWILDRAFPVRDATGQIIRIVGIAAEVTERKGNEAEVLQANLRLVSANEELERQVKERIYSKASCCRPKS